MDTLKWIHEARKAENRGRSRDQRSDFYEGDALPSSATGIRENVVNSSSGVLSIKSPENASMWMQNFLTVVNRCVLDHMDNFQAAEKREATRLVPRRLHHRTRQNEFSSKFSLVYMTYIPGGGRTSEAT